MNNSASNTDDYLASLPEWQREKLIQFRTLIHDVVPDVREEIKWGVPSFFDGTNMLFVMASFKQHVKYNFIANGAQLTDDKKLFNNGLESKKSRAIDVRENDQIDTVYLKSLIQASVDLSRSA